MQVNINITPDNYENYEVILNYIEEKGISLRDFFNQLIQRAAKDLKTNNTLNEKQYIDTYIYDLAIKYLEYQLTLRKEVAKNPEEADDQEYKDNAVRTVLPLIAKDSRLAENYLSGVLEYDYYDALNLIEQKFFS